MGYKAEISVKKVKGMTFNKFGKAFMAALNNGKNTAVFTFLARTLWPLIISKKIFEDC